MSTFSLVIHCYNEALTLPTLIDRLCTCYSNTQGYEIVLVNNGSSDNSAEVLARAAAEHPFVRIVDVPVNQGYGWGILQGLAAAKGAYLGWTHADMQTDPGDAIEAFAQLQLLNAPLAFVKGRRYGRPLADVLFTVGMSCFDSALFGMPLWDINAQPTVFSRAFYHIWQDPPKDFALDLYVYAMARKAGARIARFPVLFAKRQHGTSHWNINWKAKVKFIKRTIDFSFALKRTWK